MRSRSRTPRPATTTSPTSRRTAGASSSRATTARASSFGATTSKAARACAHGERRRQPRAAHLAGWPADRLRFDRRHRAFQPEDCRPRACGAFERALSRRAAREQDRPLLLFDARPHDQPVVVAGRQARLLRHECGDSLGYGLDLLGCASTAANPNALSKHQLESSWAARPEVGPDGKRILVSSYHGGPVAPALADDDR